MPGWAQLPFSWPCFPCVLQTDTPLFLVGVFPPLWTYVSHLILFTACMSHFVVFPDASILTVYILLILWFNFQRGPIIILISIYSPEWCRQIYKTLTVISHYHMIFSSSSKYFAHFQIGKINRICWKNLTHRFRKDFKIYIEQLVRWIYLDTSFSTY